MALFKRGYAEVQKEEKRREEAKKNRGGIYKFILKEGDAEINFLTEEPISYYEHSIPTKYNGKEFFDHVPCSGADCPHCANGNRPTFKSAFLIIDRRPYKYKNKEGKEVTKDSTIRLYVVGTKVAGVLQKKSMRYGLTKYRYEVSRIGKDTNTTYMFENLDKEKVKSSEIEELLPTDELKEMYDGTMDSLYEIIESEITKAMPNSKDVDDEDDDDTTTSKYDEDLVGYDDEDEEDEEPPTPKKITKKKTTIKKKGLTIKKKK